MMFRVEYWGDPKDAAARWTFIPLEQNLDGAIAQARLASAAVKDYLGARTFRVLDGKREVFAEPIQRREGFV